MKKTLTKIAKCLILIYLVSITFTLQAQNVFQEDFDGISGITSGGAGTYVFPAGWSLFNIDGITPASNVAYVNAAWVRREDFKTNVSDSCAFSTSWYSPAGKADDWMFTPAIGPLPANCILKWNAVAYDALYPDGYEVRVMTQEPTAENILTSTVLFTEGAENSSWTERKVSLSDYAGLTVYIAFRNISTDMFLLAIDDITVEVQVNTDVSLISAGRLSQYTMIPSQQLKPFILQDTIINKGSMDITNVQLKVNVYDDSFNPIYTASSEVVSAMAPGKKQYFTVGEWSPAKAGKYYFSFFPVMSEADQVASNDTLKEEIEITDTIYSRDRGNAEGSLGIGAGTGGFMGQKFTIVNPTDLRSVTYYVTAGYTGEKTACAIWNMASGKPDVMIAVTDTILYPDKLDHLFSIPVAGGPITLVPGDYLVSVIEFDSTLSLANTSDIFTPGTVWVSWPGQEWANVETFGSSFAKSFFIRPNLYTCSKITAEEDIIGASCSTCTDGSISVVPTGGTGEYSYLWNTSETTASISGLLPGNYTLKISDAMKCSSENTYVVLNTVGMNENKISDFMVSPNPNNGQFIISSVSELPDNVNIDIFNQVGEKVYTSTYKNSTLVNDNIKLTGIAPGLHIIRFTSASYTKFLKLVIE